MCVYSSITENGVRIEEVEKIECGKGVGRGFGETNPRYESEDTRFVREQRDLTKPLTVELKRKPLKGSLSIKTGGRSLFFATQSLGAVRGVSGYTERSQHG